MDGQASIVAVLPATGVDNYRVDSSQTSPHRGQSYGLPSKSNNRKSGAICSGRRVS